MPVSLLRSETLAPATVAPLGSLTTPETLPVVFCPKAGRAAVKRNRNASIVAERDLALPLKLAGDAADLSEKLNLMCGLLPKVVTRGKPLGRAAAKMTGGTGAPTSHNACLIIGMTAKISVPWRRALVGSRPSRLGLEVRPRPMCL